MEKYRIIVKGIVQYDDKFLILEKWFDDRIVDPYQWEFINGDLSFGETPEKGVLNLVFQTTGLTVQVSKIPYTWSFMIGDVCNIGIAFLCISSSDFVSLSEEFNSYKWVAREDIKNYITNQAVIADIDRAEL